MWYTFDFKCIVSISCQRMLRKSFLIVLTSLFTFSMGKLYLNNVIFLFPYAQPECFKWVEDLENYPVLSLLLSFRSVFSGVGGTSRNFCFRDPFSLWDVAQSFWKSDATAATATFHCCLWVSELKCDMMSIVDVKIDGREINKCNHVIMYRTSTCEQHEIPVHDFV